MSTSDSKPRGKSSTKRGPKRRGWTILFATIAFSLIVFFIVRTQGHVTGKEFSPTHFQARSFSFYEIPILQIQITPIRRKGQSIGAANYLRQKSLINPGKGLPEYWHLIQISRGLSGQTLRDAELLTHQLEMSDDSGSVWKQWSVDHPKRAAVLWPVTQKLAERELYFLIPSVLEIAKRDLSPSDLDSEINAYLRAEYYDLVEDSSEAGQPELANQLLDEALGDFPDDLKLKSLRKLLPTSESVDAS